MDIELDADRYARNTAPGGITDPHGACLLSKSQVAALLRDAFIAGHERAMDRVVQRMTDHGPSTTYSALLREDDDDRNLREHTAAHNERWARAKTATQIEHDGSADYDVNG